MHIIPSKFSILFSMFPLFILHLQSDLTLYLLSIRLKFLIHLDKYCKNVLNLPFSSSMLRVIVVDELARARVAAAAWPLNVGRTRHSSSRSSSAGSWDTGQLRDAHMLPCLAVYSLGGCECIWLCCVALWQCACACSLAVAYFRAHAIIAAVLSVVVVGDLI